VFTGHT
jgi:U3 small nucleolar RNA-associated protein 13